MRENEELKKLVRLIRENQELRSAIKIQPGSINISAFANGLGEVATGPAQHQGNYKRLGSRTAGRGVRECAERRDSVCWGLAKSWKENMHIPVLTNLGNTDPIR